MSLALALASSLASSTPPLVSFCLRKWRGAIVAVVGSQTVTVDFSVRERILILVLSCVSIFFVCLLQARRQDSVTGGTEINFGGHEKFILCEFERGTGAREIYLSLDQINKVRSKKSKGFSGQNRKFKRFVWPKTGDLQKKKGLHPKNVTKSGVSPQKTLIWTSICAPEAPS